MQLNRCASLFSLVCAGSLAAAVSASGSSIAWVSFHAADDSPSTGASGAGFSQAPDIGYTSLLAANGYSVTRFLTANEFDVNQLYGYDLVIIGRGVDSTHYQSATESAAWNSFGWKVLDMGAYTLRGSRLGWYTGETPIPDTAGSVALKPTAYHPIFAGIPIDGFTGNMFNPFADLATYAGAGNPGQLARGISVLTAPLDGNPTVLATVGTESDPAVGGPVIALWDKGAIVNGGTEVLGSWRMSFLSGSREASGISSQTAGIFDLTPDGTKLFLNTINYFITVVPEPSTAALLALGGLLPLFLRRKQA